MPASAKTTQAATSAQGACTATNAIRMGMATMRDSVSRLGRSVGMFREDSWPSRRPGASRAVRWALAPSLSVQAARPLGDRAGRRAGPPLGQPRPQFLLPAGPGIGVQQGELDQVELGPAAAEPRA